MKNLQKLDFHLHTLDDPLDHHVRHTATELIDKAQLLGFSALSITLHDSQYENERIFQYAAHRGILLIPGVEKTVEGCHILLIHFPKKIAEQISTFEELRKAKALVEQETMVIAAHPFYPNSTCLKEKIFAHPSLFDAIEISGYSHRFWNPNQKARAAAAQLNLPLLGNSDTHTLQQFGTIWTEVESEPEAGAILRALKAGKGVLKGRNLGGVEMASITWKVIVMGYMPWVNYKKQRGIEPDSAK